MKVIVFGKKGCTRCAAYTSAKAGIEAGVKATVSAMGASYVYVDCIVEAKAFAAAKRAAGITRVMDALPVIAVIDDKGKPKGDFVARSSLVRPFTAAGIVKRIIALCPECCNGVCSETPATPSDEVCPTCGGTGKIKPKAKGVAGKGSVK